MRDPMSCPYREDAEVGGASGHIACTLLQAITGLDRDDCLVGHDACRACCRSPVPSESRINPVIASLLSKATAAVLTSGGRPGCPAGKAASLQDWAVKNLKVESSAEDSTSSLPDRSSERCFLFRQVSPWVCTLHIYF